MKTQSAPITGKNLGKGEMKYFFAVDLGATSGRTIVGTLDDGVLKTLELTRFENRLMQVGEYVYWDLFALYEEVVRGLSLAAEKGMDICSVGVDTWGVDFVCVGADGGILRNPLSYRDAHSFQAMEQYFKKALSREELYQRTGIQFVNYNSLFQLYGMRQREDSALNAAKKILFMPDAVSYLLTGETVCEYSIASTSQLLDAKSHTLDSKVLETLSLTSDNFGRLVFPGTVVGHLTSDVQKRTGLGPVPVVAVAGHDTASAVAAVPARNAHFAYLSSGTWSLIGIESQESIVGKESFEANFTNEGGVDGTIRFLKNICGLWLYECCRKELVEVRDKSHASLQSESLGAEPFRSLINPDDPCFANPDSMVEAIQYYCRIHGELIPETPAQIFRCIFESLALRYREVFESLKKMTPFPIEVLHIIGGGSMNNILNQFTANSLGIRVLAGPQECTALGNLMMQAKALGYVSDIWEMRHVISRNVSPRVFEPLDIDLWDKAYEKYLEITRASL